MPTLFGEYFSPWSEKARWALDHHRVAYTYREHVPLLGELALRMHAKNERASVPLLVTESGPIPDSFAIARHAESIGTGERLFPEGREDEVATWNDRSEQALRSARALYLERVSRDREAKIEMQPPAFPRFLRAALTPAADLAIAYLRRKYDVDSASSAEVRLVEALENLERTLDGRSHLIGDRLSYADIAMAVTLQFVSPVAQEFVPLGDATRISCEAPSIAARFPKLLAWRDALYRAHRGGRTG
jgi:glutathione S-transferase